MAESRKNEEHQELAVLVAYTEDDYLRERGTLNGSAQAVATAIQQAGYSRQPQLSEEDLELLRMALQNAVSRSQDVARELRSKPGVSAAASGSLTRRYRLLLERFGGPSLSVSPVAASPVITGPEEVFELESSESSKVDRALMLPSELPVQGVPVALQPKSKSGSRGWQAVPVELESEEGEGDDPTREYGVANFGDLEDVLSRNDGKRTTREWATNMLQREYGDILVARDWEPEPPLAS